MTPGQRPLRICRVIARMNVGGPAVHLTQLTAALDSERFSQLVVAGSESPGEASMIPFARARGVEPVLVPELGRELNPRADAIALVKLYRLFRRWRPDVVETHTAKAGTLGRVAALLAGVPVRVHVFHGHVFRGYFGRRKTAVFLAVERSLARATTKIITLGERQREDLLAYGIGRPDQVVTIPLGFELRPFLDARRTCTLHAELGVPATAPLVGIVGRLAPIKRPDVFLRAARRIAAGVPDAHFVIAGDGEIRAASERLAEELGIAGRTHFLGWRAHDTLPSLFADLSVLVLTSDNEGLPTALIEAMATATPVVATAVGEVPSLIDDGRTGLLAPNGNPGAIADAVVRLLRDDSLRRTLGEAARAGVYPRLDLSTLVDQMTRFYTALGRTLPPFRDDRQRPPAR